MDLPQLHPSVHSVLHAGPGFVIVGRIVDIGDISFNADMHPHAAPLLQAYPLIEQAKRHRPPTLSNTDGDPWETTIIG